MGKPTGFLEYERRVPPDRPPLERIRDWDEFHAACDEQETRIQAARCMDCGTPFCHAGTVFAGAAAGCPLGNLIPEWNDLIYRGLWREAYERLAKTNPFPEFTGRVCPAPCEGSCTLGLNTPQVTIRNNERAVADLAWAQGWAAPAPPAFRTGKSVAVVGSGPAGLACAARLNRAGHEVTVFERADRPGGLLMYGIPGMKLDKNLVESRIELLAREGVKFVTGIEVGRDYPAERLLQDFQAAVLCGGAGKPRDLSIPGRNLAGVHFALEFLGANTKSLLDSGHADGAFISAEGLDVLVIGGGDTGTDCVATALRHGCRSVAQPEIVPAPPARRAPENPWPQWPKVHKVDYGQEEAAALFGLDPRYYSTQTDRFIGGGDGRVREAHTSTVEWREENGRIVPVRLPGTEQVRPVQLVLLALGFLGPEDQLLDQLSVVRDARTNVRTATGRYATSVPGIFAAGDMRRGQSLVAWAIREGLEAAAEVDQYLRRAMNGVA